MHQNPHVSCKNSIFFWGGGKAPSPDPTPHRLWHFDRPPIIKFWIRHCQHCMLTGRMYLCQTRQQTLLTADEPNHTTQSVTQHTTDHFGTTVSLPISPTLLFCPGLGPAWSYAGLHALRQSYEPYCHNKHNTVLWGRSKSPIMVLVFFEGTVFWE